jgi:exosortase family protein XrtF
MKDLKNYSKVIRFLLTVTILYLVWFIVYDRMLADLDFWLTLKTSDASVWVLTQLGYNAESYIISYDAVTGGSMITIDGNNMVSIGPPCNALVLIALYSGFIIAFPGKFLSKLIFIPVGIVVIVIINTLRVAALAVNSLYHFQTLDFNHKYTFTIIVYAVIFLLWMLWVRRYSGISRHVKITPYNLPTT